MTEHPIERLRNKLTPFFTLVMLAKNVDIKIEDEQIKKLFDDTVVICADNMDEVRQWLVVAENKITT